MIVNTWCSRGQSVHDTRCSVRLHSLFSHDAEAFYWGITQYLNRTFPRSFKFSAIDNKKSPVTKWILCMVLNIWCVYTINLLPSFKYKVYFLENKTIHMFLIPSFLQVFFIKIFIFSKSIIYVLKIYYFVLILS